MGLRSNTLYLGSAKVFTAFAKKSPLASTPYENRPIACSKYSNNDIMRLMVGKGV